MINSEGTENPVPGYGRLRIMLESLLHPKLCANDPYRVII